MHADAGPTAPAAHAGAEDLSKDSLVDGSGTGWPPTSAKWGSDVSDLPGAHVRAENTGYTFVFVLASASRDCRGLAQLWLQLGAMMFTPPIPFSVELLPAGSPSTAVAEMDAVSAPPPVPPPKVLVSAQVLV
jgi:hypothetical protein